MSKDGQVARATRDLADHLKIDQSEISLVRAKATQWPDASLGLGKSGNSYAMIMIDGYIIELQAGGRTYTYHADEDKHVARAW